MNNKKWYVSAGINAKLFAKVIAFVVAVLLVTAKIDAVFAATTSSANSTLTSIADNKNIKVDNTNTVNTHHSDVTKITNHTDTANANNDNVTSIANNPDTSNASNSEITSTTNEMPIQKDPLEKLNRVVFTFNDKLDKFILKPIATLYNAIMPQPLNKGIHNVFLNIGTLPTMANDALQLHFYQFANDFWRFTVNTTIGIGGFFDIASNIGLKPYSNDFGLTLARYGWKSSTFIVWPFWGPSTFRDGISLSVDYYEFSVYPYIDPTSTRYEIYGLGVIDRRAKLLKFEDLMEEAAIDRYVFVRNAYLQSRNHQITQNQYRGYKDQLTNETTQ